MECDLIDPAHIHVAQNDLPEGTQKLFLKEEMPTSHQVIIIRHYSLPNSSGKVCKRVPHFMPKRKYLVNYRNLRFYLKEGLVVEKIHRVLQFNQSPWLAPYISKSQDIRAKAQNDFEKDRAKRYNNEIYVKPVKNKRKKNRYRLGNNPQKCKNLIEKPNLRDFEFFQISFPRWIYAKLKPKSTSHSMLASVFSN